MHRSCCSAKTSESSCSSGFDTHRVFSPRISFVVRLDQEELEAATPSEQSAIDIHSLRVLIPKAEDLRIERICPAAPKYNPDRGFSYSPTTITDSFVAALILERRADESMLLRQ